MGFLWCSLPRAFDKGKHVHLVISSEIKMCKFICHYIWHMSVSDFKDILKNDDYQH